MIGHRHPVDTLCQVFVAASDATDHHKRFADFVLADGETLNGALEAIGFDTGKVHLSDGTFPDDAA